MLLAFGQFWPVLFGLPLIRTEWQWSPTWPNKLRAFDDDGTPIRCPSGNIAYVHPISGDLQQCTQTLGFYNQTTCPGGTVCERFPILVPGFQDYCCWAEDTSEPESQVIATTSEAPETLYPFTDRPLPGSIVATEEPHGSGESGGSGGGGGGVDGSEGNSGGGDGDKSGEDGEWITEPPTTTKSSRRTRRPNRRKTTTTEPTTTTTTTMATTTRLPPHRGPKCRNSDDAALIDFGNRLRDCYYQQCPYGYRCEFNGEIRRYICCGKEREVYPPPGLPPIPDPKPIVPMPFRPRPPPFARTNTNTLLGTENDFYCRHGQEAFAYPGTTIQLHCDPISGCPDSHPVCGRSALTGRHVCCDPRRSFIPSMLPIPMVHS